MKHVIKIWFVLSLIITSCNKEASDLSVGYITGADQAKCLCCGGYFIEIGNETYRFLQQELPAGSINFELIDSSFPIKVRVRWKLKEDGCAGDEIIISKIQVIN